MKESIIFSVLLIKSSAGTSVFLPQGLLYTRKLSSHLNPVACNQPDCHEPLDSHMATRGAQHGHPAAAQPVRVSLGRGDTVQAAPRQHHYSFNPLYLHAKFQRAQKHNPGSAIRVS